MSSINKKRRVKKVSNKKIKRIRIMSEINDLNELRNRILKLQESLQTESEEMNYEDILNWLNYCCFLYNWKKD